MGRFFSDVRRFAGLAKYLRKPIACVLVVVKHAPPFGMDPRDCGCALAPFAAQE